MAQSGLGFWKIVSLTITVVNKLVTPKKIYTTGKIVAMFLTVLMICFSCPVSAEWFDQTFEVTHYDIGIDEEDFTGNFVTANGIPGTYREDFLYSARGVSMQGTGLTRNDEYIRYDSGGGGWVNQEGDPTESIPDTNDWTNGRPYWVRYPDQVTFAQGVGGWCGPVTPGTSVAADLSVLPCNSNIFIDGGGIGFRRVDDKGGAITGHCIDVLVPPAITDGNYRVYVFDTEPPNAVTNIQSPSHSNAIGQWNDPQSKNNRVTVTWTNATDNIQAGLDANDVANGLDGYSIVWDHSPNTLPDKTKDIEEVESTTSPPLANGNDWYFHIRSVDNGTDVNGNGIIDDEANWDDTAVHLGPFYIEVISLPKNVFNYNVPYLRQQDYPDCGESACGPTSIAMLIRYNYPISSVTGYDIYHMGTQGYGYYADTQTGAPAIGYRNVGFAKGDTGLNNILEDFRKYYHGTYSGMTLSAGVRALEYWGGDANSEAGVSLSRAIDEIKNRPLLLNVYEAAGIWVEGHWIVLRGYRDDNGIPGDYDDKFYINDPYTSSIVPNGENREITYAHLDRIFKKNIITYNPTQTEEQRRYTVLVDNGFIQNICPSPAGNFEVNLDALDGQGDYIWLEYYNSAYGDWVYPIRSGQSAKWVPILSMDGTYEIHVILSKDQNQDNVNYTIYDPDGIEIGNKTINQEGSGWCDENLGTFPLIMGSYVRVDDMPAQCNADAIRFEYILSISITSPTQSSPASVGAYENPKPIEYVIVAVKQGTTPVTGLTEDDFTFKIGGKTATASLINSWTSDSACHYKFLLTPPKQDAAGKYDLEVILKYKGYTLEDKEKDAVIYTTAGGHADVMLIIDRSGSMRWSSPAIEDAKTSAKLFVDYMRYGDKAGVVSFASSASYTYFLDTLDADIKWAIKNAIDSITAGGNTAMGEGLRYGLNNLNTLGDPAHAWAMVLLSDGYQNQGEHPNTVLPDIKASNIRVFTIGLGDDVDKALLEHIATETGGKYYHAATSDQLREIYESIVGKVVGWQTILEQVSQIFKDQIKQIFAPIEDAFEAIFRISWGGSDLDLVLYKPDGTKIDPAVAATDPNIEYVKEATYTFYRVTDPDPGQWTMEVTGVDVPPEGEEFTATVKAISTLNLYLSTDKDKYNQDEVIKTIASITEGGLPITGATVNADITMPDGSTETLVLYDDGGHGDIAANDGVYANYFTNTGQIGTYKIDAAATGTTPSGTLFSRQAETTVEVVAGQSVITLIPDIWNETVNASEKIEKTFNVSDPPTVGEKFIINKDLYAEYNGTHYLVYEESSIGGEPDYILSALPTTEKSLATSNVSKWVLLTPTSLETPTGDLIDASNIILTPSTVQVPLNGSEKFFVSINIPSDAISGVYSGKIVATTIGGSDSIDLEITVIGKREPGIKIKVFV